MTKRQKTNSAGWQFRLPVVWLPLSDVRWVLLFLFVLSALFPLRSFSQCSNCTISNNGDDVVVTFTSGSNTFTPPAGVSQVEYLIVGGGGGGGNGTSVFILGSYGGGGGGAGGVVTGTRPVTATPYNVTVGSGGSVGNNGGNSSFASLTALGGGAGGTPANQGGSGGSGGGGGGAQGAGGSGTGGQGNDGADGAAGFLGRNGGGGGGATTAGQNESGGAGFSSSLTGAEYGRGGNGGTAAASSAVGAVNTGNGGGGGYGTDAAGAGGSGIVVIRYQLPGAYYTRFGGGNWSAASTWSNAGCNGGAAGSIPHAAAHVTICNGHAVTLNVNGSAQSVLLQTGNQNVSLTHSGNSTLTVGSGGLTLQGATSGNNIKSWNIASGTAVVNGPVTLQGGNHSNRRVLITLSDGVLDINGALTFNSSDVTRAGIEMTGAADIFLSGAFTPGGNATVIPGTASTFTYDGSGTQAALLGVSQINYHHLVFAGSGTKSQTTWNTPIITGTTTVNSGVTFNNSASVIYQGNYINGGTSNVTAAQQYQGNFTNAGSYTTNASLQTFNGSTPQQIIGETTFTRLSLNNAAGLTINADVVVLDQLQLDNGQLTTGGNTLRVAQAAGWSGVTRGTGWVAGNLGLWMPVAFQARTFDIGDGSGYRPLVLTMPSVTTAGYVVASVSQSPGDHPQIGASALDASLSVNRWWSVASEGAAAASMDITFNFLAADVDGGADPQAFEIRRNGGGTWNAVTVGSRAAASIQGTAISGFGEFAVAEPSTSILAPVVEYRMDEPAWNGVAGEVLDSSGNDSHGTAVGGVDTAGVAPALTGDPGTCRYGVFDGVNDYVAAGPISDTLNATASLAFWINTTQTGNNTAWEAPGIAGVEENGGADDIFWGWLDANGHIGISSGNVFTNKSTIPINNGAWRHVVLTRDHVAGTYKIYIDGALNNSGSIATGVIGNGYSSIGRVENTGGAAQYFNGWLDEVRIYDAVLSDAEVAAIRVETHPCASSFCPSGTPRGGMPGDYFNNMDLSGSAMGARIDGPVDFNWAGAAPGVPGIGPNQFSVDWNGYIRTTVTGNYRFQTVSDDGVRLWVNSQPVIQRWNDHSAATDTSVAVFLTAGEVYPIRLQYYENGGDAVIRLRWETPSTPGTFNPIPAGPEPALGAGLYYCDTTVVRADHYAISHAGSGLTCEAEPITITAHDSADNPVSPSAGTQITLDTTPAGATWVGGNTYVFDGSATSAIVYLQQTTPATLNIHVSDGVASENEDPNITFADVGLRFYGNDALTPMPHQVAGVVDNSPVLRVVETSTDTGACVARIQDRSHNVGLAYECRDPDTCSAGQALTLAGNVVQSHDSGAAITHTSTTLSFNANGFAAIPLEYTDVGRLRLHGQLQLPAEGDEPDIFVSGTSTEFVVKPDTLAVVRVERPDTTANPATTSAGAGFVAAGENFRVVVEARNADGNRTPAFGRETATETVRLANVPDLVYPPGGNPGALSAVSSFNPVAGTPGQMENIALSWSEVGSIRVTPRLGDDDYLGAGDLNNLSPSGTIGRFYPFEYILSASSTTEACGFFSYMGQPGIEVSYQLTARGSGLGALSNYDNNSLGYGGTAAPNFVAENADSGVDLSGRITVTPAGNWLAGVMDVEAHNSYFARAALPEAPLTQVRIGMTVSDALDGRPLTGLDMNAGTSGDCVMAATCNAKMLGNEMEVRFGRLRLTDAFGPETAALPVAFMTEYWDGALWVQNTDDSCTRIAAADITYPGGPVDNAANLTTALNGSFSTGSYGSLAGGVVSFVEGDAEQSFSPPGAGNTGAITVDVNVAPYPWLQFDWNQDGSFSDPTLPTATFTFGSYRGHDRIIFWQEVFQ